MSDQMFTASRAIPQKDGEKEYVDMAGLAHSKLPQVFINGWRAHYMNSLMFNTSKH